MILSFCNQDFTSGFCFPLPEEEDSSPPRDSGGRVWQEQQRPVVGHHGVLTFWKVFYTFSLWFEKCLMYMGRLLKKNNNPPP